MFGNNSNTRSLPLYTKKSSNQSSPMTENPADGKLLFDQSTASSITLTEINVSKMASPTEPDHTSTPIATGSMDITDHGKSNKSKGHRRSKSLERGANISIKLLDTSGIPIPKRM